MLMPSVTAFAARFGWSTVPYMKSKSVTTIIVACWHAKGLDKCGKSIRYSVVCRVLPCTTGNADGNDASYRLFVLSWEARMARDTCFGVDVLSSLKVAISAFVT
jgi:hypothetical protein